MEWKNYDKKRYLFSLELVDLFLNLEPQNLIYIGDRLDVDAVASNDSGMKGVWINRKRSADKKLMGSYSENNLPKNISEIYSLSHLDEIIK